jgi:hypothetical protein
MKRELAHTVEVAEVAQAGDDVLVPGRGDDLRPRLLAALLAAHEQAHARPEPREALGGGEAEPGRRGGDEHDLPVDAWKRVPGSAAQAHAGVRIAGDDRSVENRVEQ